MNYKEQIAQKMIESPEFRALWREGGAEGRIRLMLHEGRARLGLTQRQMARHLGIPRHHLKEAEETGKISPREFRLFLIGMGLQEESPETEQTC